jgi:hypothetical protein
MNMDDRLAVVAAQLENELRREFPHWRIRREDSGRWTASHDIYDDIHANSAGELREKLHARW